MDGTVRSSLGLFEDRQILEPVCPSVQEMKKLYLLKHL